MSNPPAWSPTRGLAEGESVLLEASAGTGKTWQIEGLVVRLVAEFGVRIERLLIITFTREATADLRDRVRRRLVAARDALQAPVAPTRDPVIAALWSDEAQRSERRRRLLIALAEFDRAAISTIHGFCQRTLDQLAFESGQEPQLAVVADAGEVRDELVADALASVWARASSAEAAALTRLGFTRKGLTAVARIMTAPVRLEVRPALVGEPLDPLDALRAAVAETAALASFVASPAGQAAIAAFDDEAARPSRSKARTGAAFKRIPGFTRPIGEPLSEWLAAGAPADRRDKSPLNWLPSAALAAKWASDPGDAPEHFGGWPLSLAIDRVRAAQDAARYHTLAGFAFTARDKVEAELSRRALLTYDGMLSRLAEAVDAERQAPDPPLAAAIRSRFDVALVDEFQDTDQAQWTVLREVFAHASRRLYLIGDPKQAIYAFRGADLDVYMEAADCAERFALSTNFRTDQPLVEATNAAYASCASPFGLAGIAYVPVAADKPLRVAGLPALVGDGPSRLAGALAADAGEPAGPARHPLELRWLGSPTFGLTAPADGPPPKLPTQDECRGIAAASCAAECRRLLTAAVSIPDPKGATPDARRELRPGDIAVLVHTHDEAALVADALRESGVPAITGRRTAVFRAPAVHWICSLLDALAAPGDARKAGTLAVTPLFGWTAGDLLRALSAPGPGDDADAPVARAAWQDWREAIEGWAGRWPKLGALGVITAAFGKYRTIARLLGSEHGERAATDVRHLAELLHAEDRRTHGGPRALLDWLRSAAAAASAAADDEADEQAMRLESDAEAVQILTLHVSKGLQYPIVLLPFAWAPEPQSAPSGPVAYRDRTGPVAVPALSLHAKGTPERTVINDAYKSARDDEKLRLLYVGLTRAEHHCVAWLSASDTAADSPISRLLLEGCAAKGLDFEVRALARLRALQASTPGIGVAVEPPPSPVAARWRPRDRAEPSFDHDPWPKERRLGTGWMVASYSGIGKSLGVESDDPSARAREAGLCADSAGSADHSGGAENTDDTDDTDDTDGTDGTDTDGSERDHAQGPAFTPPPAPLLDGPILGAALPGRAETGDWLHALLEELDFEGALGSLGRLKSPSSTSETVSERIAALGRQHARPAPEHHALVERLLPGWLDTPLDAPMGGGPGGVDPGFSLRALGKAHRLDELAFDLRLGAGANYRPSMGEIGRVRAESVRLALADALATSPALGARAWLELTLAATDSAGRPRAIVPRIAGLLTGFIDLVFRVGGAGADARYFVADYKSNRIRGHSPDGTPAPVVRGNYARPWLGWAMDHAAYHLQALVYTLALHRLLALRLGPAYDYDRHIGGHLYLFLMGMEGLDTPRVDGACLGVWADRWPRRTVLGLDAALLGASEDEVRRAMDGSPTP